MHPVFKALDKPLPKYIENTVRIWIIGFFGIFVIHANGKFRQMDDKVNTALFDARIQQIKSSGDQKLQLMEMQHELGMKQIQQLNQRVIELEKQLRQLTALQPADAPTDNISVSSF